MNAAFAFVIMPVAPVKSSLIAVNPPLTAFMTSEAEAGVAFGDPGVAD